MRIPRLLMPILVIIALLGTVQIANALNWWQTSGQDMLDLENMTADDIRGWMSLELISEGLGIPVSEIAQVLGLPADTPPETAMKDLEGLVEVSEARELLAGYIADPKGFEAPTPAPTPTRAAAPEVEPTATHEPGTGDGTGEGTGSGPTPVPAGQLGAADIKGRMTLREVSEGTGLALADILAEANLPANTSPNTQLKDLVSQVEGFEVEAVREAVERLLSR